MCWVLGLASSVGVALVATRSFDVNFQRPVTCASVALGVSGGVRQSVLVQLQASQWRSARS
jgi:hypothetical protein